MEEYIKKIEENKKRNEKYIKEFEEWLNSKGLVKKTIRKHLQNIDFYINNYLTYYDIVKVEEGIDEVHLFLNCWFIEKCLWASKNSIKENATSIKKFYQFMSENNYVKKEDYEFLCNDIKENMDEYLSQIERMENVTFYDI